MRKLLLALTACAGLTTAQAQGVYQIPNSDFENWASEKEPGNGWNSFASAGGTLKSFASMSPSPEKAEGHNSETAVRLTSKNLWIANANGNLTTGRINMGSMSPADAANYNFTDLTDSIHSLPFAGTPDSVACYAKFISGGSENGRGQFILHDEYGYRDPETSNEEGYESHKVALAAIMIPSTAEWTRFAAPFEYTGVEKPEKQYMLASFTTNPLPGGSANDTLYVDEVTLIYNSELASLKYDGQDLFVAGQTLYDLPGVTYDESKLECTSNGRAATIEKDYDEDSGVLTITVKGDDWSEENLNQHVYTMRFKGVYQLPNSDFENWASDKEPGNGWNSFASAGGTLAAFASMSPSPEKVEGHNSETAVRLTSKNLFIADANGNLTTGRINMGSMSPADSANYNFTDLTDATHSVLFAGTPDSVVCYAKFISSGSENGRGQFIIHDDYRYCDPETSNEEGYESHKVALAAIMIPDTAEWTRFAAPFEYTGLETPAKQYMLASFTTNPVPGGSANDTLYIDGVELIYNSELASLKYDGKDILVAGKYLYELPGSTYDESKLEYTSNGRAATIEKSYNEATEVLTITVKGDDWSEDNLNQHVYSLRFKAVYQLPNSDFENWASDKEPGNGWNSFASAGGTLAAFASMSPSPEKVEGHNSETAVRLTSKNLFIADANGNLTTGRINMGSMSPADSANYNFTDLTDATHSVLFAGTPDSVVCYAKFISSGSENGRGQFILHDDYRYCDPETSNLPGYESHKVALAAIMIPDTAEWTRFAAPFEYTGVEKPELQYMLASFTTNPVPGGSANDTLYVDDVKLIYNSELASLTFDGQDFFVTGQAEYDLSAYAYDENKLACTSNGRAATIEKSFDETTQVMTITVKGDDWSEDNLNQHTYTIQFKGAEATEYTNSLLVGVAGNYTAPTEQTIQLIEEIDGSYSFFLPDFAFSGMQIGDIKVENLERTENGETVTYTGSQTISLMGGMMTVTPNVAATVNGDKLTAEISIPEVNVEVTFAPELLIDSDTDIAEGLSGLYNVTIDRTFAAGWNAVCLPYATTIAELGATQAQEFTKYTGGALTFDKVSDGNLKANTPYLVYFEEETAQAGYFSMEIAGSTPETVSQGEVSFIGNYEAGKDMTGAYVLTEIDGKQYLAAGESTLGSTSAYFTVEGEVTTEIPVLFDGEESAINSVKANGGAFDVYTIDGIKVRENVTNLNGLPRGIYIVNGKKVAKK